MDGSNAWRLLVYELRNSNCVRGTQLRDAAKFVPECAGPEQVSTHPPRIERNIRGDVATAGHERQPAEADTEGDLAILYPKSSANTRNGAS